MNNDNTNRSFRKASAGVELTRVEEAFFGARTVEADIEWAQDAFVRLVLFDVKIEIAESALTEAAWVVGESQAPPAELFGPAFEWAEGQVIELKREGVDALEKPMHLSVRQMLVYSLCSAAVFSVLLCGVLLLGSFFDRGVDPPQFTIGLGIMPWLISLVTFVLINAYTRASEHFSFAKAGSISAGVIVIGAAAVAGIVMPLGQYGPKANIFWTAALVPGYALLCFFVSKLWCEPQESESAAAEQVVTASSVPDDQWLARAQKALRGRGDLGEHRISEAMAEISMHASEQGTSLVREFGNPEGYAQSLPGDPRVKPRRLTLLYTVLALAWLIMGLGTLADHQWDFGWSLTGYFILVVLCLCQVVRYTRRARHAISDA